MTIHPFVAGILVTILAEIIIFIIALFKYASVMRRDTSNSSRREKDE